MWKLKKNFFALKTFVLILVYFRKFSFAQIFFSSQIARIFTVFLRHLPHKNTRTIKQSKRFLSKNFIINRLIPLCVLTRLLFASEWSNAIRCRCSNLNWLCLATDCALAATATATRDGTVTINADNDYKAAGAAAALGGWWGSFLWQLCVACRLRIVRDAAASTHHTENEARGLGAAP